MGEENRLSKLGEASKIIDGANMVKTTVLGKALIYLGVSKLNSLLLSGLLAAPAYSISFGLRAYEDSEEEGWVETFTTEAMQNVVGMGFGT